ncbi:organic solute transporter subunit alpha/Transmembrane protein, partial [Polychytrium aggregatum]|uniref:organic solute transporter subunit alpha/Transmembrane protein n=1 Tax=Polychytrium aggregatum TaxID=110093 RepID=UPI0022FE204F
LELHSYMWAACGALAFFATVISGYLISTHLRNFSNPSQQRHIVRILLFIPIYSILSWCAFRYYTYAVYYFMIRDCYEAFVVYSFYALIMSYAGDVEEHLKTKGMMKYPFIGFLLPRYNPASRWFLPGNRVAVLQYVVVRPVMTLVAVVLQALQRYCPESFSPVYGHFWYMVLNVTSVSICMYALITMYYTIHDEIESYNPFSKFLSIKLVILLTMWQNLLIGMLVHYGVIQATQYWSRTNVGNGVQSMLVCFEMFVVSIVHLYAFSAKGYSNTGSKSLSFGKALSLCLNPVD